MRLCLDEHYSPTIAAEQSARGHDAISVPDRPALGALPDDRLLDLMVAEGRAIVTENASDFVPIVRRLALEGRSHHGLRCEQRIAADARTAKGLTMPDRSRARDAADIWLTFRAGGGATEVAAA